MAARQRCHSRTRRVWFSAWALALCLGWVGATSATTYYAIPFYIKDFDTNNNPVQYSWGEISLALDGTKQFLAARYPAGTNCQVASAYENATQQAQGNVAKVYYVSTDPSSFVCPSHVIEIQLSAYDNNPEKNTGDAGNCNGGDGVQGGDGIVTCPGTPLVLDPINLATGNKYDQESDFDALPWLTFRRFYNSQASVRPASMGPQWRHSFDRSLLFQNTLVGGGGTSYIQLLRADGRSERFMPTANGGWAADPNIPDTLTADSTGFTVYVAGPNQFERYSTSGQLQYIADATGQTTTLTYSGGKLQTVTDPFGRTLQFAYDGAGLLHTVTLPDGGVLTYGYTNGTLTSVQYPDSKTKQYVYNEPTYTGGANLPYALTGVIDEAGVRYDTTGYSATNGRAVSSSHAGGANAGSVTGGSSSFATMTFPLGASGNVSMKDDGYGAIKLTGTFAACNTDWCKQKYQTIQYDTNGYPSQYTDFTFNVTKLTYNTAGLETQRIEGYNLASLGQQRTINTTWDTTLRNPLTRITLDSNNNPITQSAWVYNSTGQVTARCEVDPAVSGASSYTCGSNAQAPGGVRQWTYTYCTSVDGTQCPVVGLKLTEDGPRTDVSDITHYSYYLTTDTSGCATPGGACHRAGDLYQVADALGHVTTNTAYDQAGRPTRLIDANGVITDLTYTPRGWLKTRTVAGATTTYTYKPYGAVESITDADGVTITYGYDNAHRLTDITDAQGNHIHYTLDAAGNRTDEATYAVGSSTPSRHLSRTFNNLGQLTKIIDGLNHTIFDASASGGYDANGNLVTSVDALGVTQTRSYDGLNRYSGLQSSATVNGSTVVSSTSYTYDVLDNLTQTLTPDYKYTTSAYDGLSNRKTLTSPDTGTTSSTFDVAGNVLTRTDAKNVVATSSYDALNRVTATTYVDTSLNVAYHYDEADSVTGCVGSYPVGRLTRMVEASVTTVYCYDARGNVTQKSQTEGSVTDVTGYSYTSADRLASVVTPSGTSVQYQHDTVGRISAITALPPGTTGAGTGNIATSITYLPFGPVASYTLGNGQTVTRTYDLNYQVTDATSPALNLHFARDAMGRITALGNVPGANPATETYGYDWLSRLTGVNNAAGTSVESYTYDAIGNRTGKTGSGLATGTYSYYQYPHNWLSYIGSAARTYDNNGNTTASSVGGESFGFGYNGRNRMTIAQRNGSTVGTYTYNALGERVAKVATLPASLSQRFAYDESSQLIGEYGGTTRDYIWLEDLPLAVIDTQGTVSTTNYVHADGLNTPRAVADSTGATVWQWAYQSNPFGEAQPSSTSGYTLNVRFAGQYYDAESRIAYNINRHYEAATGRYLQSDPTGLDAGPSTYGYANLSPLTFTDQLGLLPTPLPKQRQRTVPCKTAELEQCQEMCAQNGTTVQSCRMNELFKVTRIVDDKSLDGWVPSKLSCSCKEPPRRPWIVPEPEPTRSPAAVSPKCDCTDPIECATH